MTMTAHAPPVSVSPRCAMETPGPAFPLFVQLNARLVEVDDQVRHYFAPRVRSE